MIANVPRLTAWLKANGVWMIIKSARSIVGLKLNWARSYLDDNKTDPTECLVETEWGLDDIKMCPMEYRVETELG